MCWLGVDPVPALLVASATLQALMATLLWWQGRSIAQAAGVQAEAAHRTFALNYGATLAASAEATRQELESRGLYDEAVAIERALTNFFALGAHPEDEAVEAGLEAIRVATAEGTHKLRLRKDAERRRGERLGPAAP